MPRKTNIKSYADYLAQSQKAAQRLAALRKALTEVQQNCKHSKLEFQPDPAGGHDSYYFCMTCGAKL